MGLVRGVYACSRPCEGRWTEKGRGLSRGREGKYVMCLEVAAAFVSRGNVFILAGQTV